MTQATARGTTRTARAPGPARDRGRDGAEFQRLIAPYRRELLAHCYRMLGSVHDAEDQLQETCLRAWRHYGDFEGRASLRTWLYRIATNTCLTAIEQRGRRPMPSGIGAPSEEPERPVVASPEVPWLEPAPDALVGAGPADPAAVVADRESVRLALVAALQHLPPRQRAVLLLRDVLKWRAAEVAELFETTTASVNSALQRARAQLARVAPERDAVTEPEDPAQRALLDRYAHAFETADIAGLVELFRKDAVWEMPPYPQWFTGADAIGRLIRAQCGPEPGELRMVPVRANGQPAFAMYRRGGDGVHRPFQIQVLDTGPDGVAHVGAFFDTTLFPLFGLPGEL
ncbi:sigma-70 family RNA polymerase sigma factor [Actinomadura parmotrematis]|uniref:Sigma-70 family RNA polymerase sigma factor n=1 Tax=Actinomadura parmotrematis TaxID=2864039 RepID=A0ABS7G613_9ACTN|nr:sigma-70 family RNA polymerase sigma factor [Actinomadura parmotrematis]MBW8487665.1 sigma-70 family RNA polymerase sigma factor [Actinomadura parmotrematis]